MFVKKIIPLILFLIITIGNQAQEEIRASINYNDSTSLVYAAGNYWFGLLPRVNSDFPGSTPDRYVITVTASITIPEVDWDPDGEDGILPHFQVPATPIELGQFVVTKEPPDSWEDAINNARLPKRPHWGSADNHYFSDISPSPGTAGDPDFAPYSYLPNDGGGGDGGGGAGFGSGSGSSGGSGGGSACTSAGGEWHCVAY